MCVGGVVLIGRRVLDEGLDLLAGQGSGWDGWLGEQDFGGVA